MTVQRAWEGYVYCYVAPGAQVNVVGLPSCQALQPRKLEPVLDSDRIKEILGGGGLTVTIGGIRVGASSGDGRLAKLVEHSL
mmetsp:Transcript_139939/g.243670  ORF Transcript_139939/g.243670 Transcript_139939/m.243670 type:complete len:82 (+) Transcript_139939:988-1233(+)